MNLVLAWQGAVYRSERSAVATAIAVLVLCTLPMLLTPVLPSIDFYAHAVRYNVLAHPGAFADNYTSHWAMLPNLGMDLLGTAAMSILPPLAAAHLLAILVVLAPVAGCMRLSIALNGKVDPLPAVLAGLLSYNLILFWGFANFLLGTGLALWSIGWWISVQHRPRLQLMGMTVMGVLILFTHGLVFGLWGLMLGMIEIGLALDRGRPQLSNLVWRALRLFAMAVPAVLLFLRMRTADGEGGMTGALDNLARIGTDQGIEGVRARILDELEKRVDSVLRVAETTMPPADSLFGVVLWAMLALGLWQGWLRLDRRVGPAAALALALILLMPPNLFGVGHLDERMPFLFLAMLIAGLTAAPTPRQRALPLLLMALVPIHIAMAGWAMTSTGAYYRHFLSTIGQIDTGRLAVSVFQYHRNERDRSMRCKPLVFLLQLRNGTAVSTFSNPTQQPLRLSGPLMAAQAGRPGDLVPFPQAVAQGFGAGFDTVMACTSGAAPQIDGTRIVASGPDWAIYRATDAAFKG